MLRTLLLAAFLAVFSYGAQAINNAPGTNCPVASANQWGCVKIGTGFSFSASGALNATATGGGGGSGTVNSGTAGRAAYYATTGTAVSGTALAGVTTGGFFTGAGALATTATTGFSYIPTSAGAPTGTPITLTGYVPMEYDTTNNRFYIYSGTWAAQGMAMSSIVAATTTNSPDNLNFAQTWQWTTLDTGTALTITAPAMTTGTALAITATGSGPALKVTGNASLSGTTTVGNLTVTGTCTNCGAGGGLPTSLFASTTNTTSITFLNAVTTSNVIGMAANGADQTSIAVGPKALLAQTSTGNNNTAVGLNALAAVTTETKNTAIGSGALASLAMGGSTTAGNTAGGYNALNAMTTNTGVTAIGYLAGAQMTSNGSFVTLVGAYAGYTATSNNTQATFIGYKAGYLSTGVGTLVGYCANCNAAAGSNTTAIGNSTLFSSTGANNTAVGAGTATAITTGTSNTILGQAVGSAGITTGSQNILIGGDNTTKGALANTTSAIAIGANTIIGSKDVAVGVGALAATTTNNNGNAALGFKASPLLTTGTGNVSIGINSGGVATIGSGNIWIGHDLSATTSSDSNTLNLGGLVKGDLTNVHVNYGGAAPVLSACGTSPTIDANATDTSGTVTVGTVAASSCTVTFNKAFTSYVHCRVAAQTASLAAVAYSYSITAITITGTSLIGALFDYSCDGK